MTERIEVPLQTRQRQALAGDPSVSAWVSANAGSGKTFVLSRRVIRLLLAGNDPSRILCLTFTKAAAAEMANRIFEELGKWVTLRDAELTTVLEELTGERPGADLVQRARQLFALALDTPGGLKIQTIHAFCEALLHQFPLEANISGHFQVMEEDTQASLLETARRQAIAAAERDASHASGGTNWFSVLLELASDAQIEKALGELIGKREKFRQWSDGDADTAMAPLWARHGMSPELGEQDLIAETLAESAIDDTMMDAVAQIAEQAGGSTNEAFAKQAIQLVASRDTQTRYALRKQIFLTGKGEPRKRLVTKDVLGQMTGLEELLETEKQKVFEGERRLAVWRVLKSSHALFYLADTVIERYEKLKRQRGLADFDDLISATANLLLRQDVGLWVQYKLDRGIDHVLVDEAQDTSPVQWQIINAVIEDFFSGQGASQRNRTVFAVGDEKQSIYSFQGADPAEFSSQHNVLSKRAAGAGKLFKPVELQLSFRSVPDILAAVDEVFADEGNFRGLGAGAEGRQNRTVHEAIRRQDPGEVRVWPLYAKEAAQETESWLDPPDTLQGSDPQVRLAERIADTIHEWVARGEKLPGADRKLRCGDILILVRRRDRFVTAMVRALKARELAIAGTDRLRLTEHIAVEDLMAVGRLVTMPEDDLSLAAVLKSPLFGHDDDMLIDLCRGRGEEPLLDHLRLLAGSEDETSAPAQNIVSRIERWRWLARSNGVHDFYCRLLGEEGGRRAMIGRLGNEAEEVIDAFLQMALDHDLNMATGLDGFIAALDRTGPEIKRNADMKRDEIRVLTVHAAKGLEAPVVFLVDPCSPAHISQHKPAVVQAEEDGEEAWYWQMSGKSPVDAVARRYDEIEIEAEEEYRRLLYVGMTRAADRLIVCGYRGSREIKHDHWHAMISRILLPGSREVVRADGSTEHIWKSSTSTRERPLDAGKENLRPSLEAAPDWLRKKVPIEKPAQRPLSPSRAAELLLPGENNRNASDAGQSEAEEEVLDTVSTGFALEYGNAIHALLQYLPELEASERHVALERWLSARTHHWTGEERESARRQVEVILADENLGMLFAPGSRAEANIAGHVEIGGRPVLVSGQIDRLATHNDEIIIADYKSNRQVPEFAGDVPVAYVTQLALYRALLQQIHPLKNVRCLLVWTQNASATELPPLMMDDALAELARM